MAADAESIAFIHLSDTHLGTDKDFALCGNNTFEAASRAVARIAHFTGKVDFVVHTGDLSATPDPRSLGIAAGLFSQLRYPTLFVGGNHDPFDGFTGLSDISHACWLDKEHGRASCGFEMNGTACLSLDCRGPADIDPHGLFDTSRQEILAAFLREHRDKPVILFTHFPLLPMNCPWIDDSMLCINGERFHEMLRESPAIIKGVFFGHVHRKVMQYIDGILYVSAASTVCQFGIMPYDREVRFLPQREASCNYVTLDGSGVTVREIGL